MVDDRSTARLPRTVSRRAVITMIAVTAALVVIHFSTRRIDPADSTFAGLRTVFDFDQEGTVPTWWNALLLAAISMVLFTAAALGGAGARPSRRSLVVGGVVAGYLATDEAAQLHELANAPVREELDRQGLGFDTFVWVIPGTVVAVVLAVEATRWCRTLPPGIGRGVMVALGLYFLGALGVEALSGWLFFEEDDDRYGYAVLVEELLEIGGSILALCMLSKLFVLDVFHGTRVLRRAD